MLFVIIPHHHHTKSSSHDRQSLRTNRGTSNIYTSWFDLILYYIIKVNDHSHPHHHQTNQTAKHIETHCSNVCMFVWVQLANLTNTLHTQYQLLLLVNTNWPYWRIVIERGREREREADRSTDTQIGLNFNLKSQFGVCYCWWC